MLPELHHKTGKHGDLINSVDYFVCPSYALSWGTAKYLLRDWCLKWHISPQQFTAEHTVLLVEKNSLQWDIAQCSHKHHKLLIKQYAANLPFDITYRLSFSRVRKTVGQPPTWVIYFFFFFTWFNKSEFYLLTKRLLHLMALASSHWHLFPKGIKPKMKK